MVLRSIITRSKSCLIFHRRIPSNMASSISSFGTPSIFQRDLNARDEEVGWIPKCCSKYYNTMTSMRQDHMESHSSVQVHSGDQDIHEYSGRDVGGARKRQIGENVSKKDRVKFLLDTLFDLPESKEAIYSTLDAWVAWERNFPVVSLKRALITLEKEHQWHRVIQVIKWMLSKGQCATMGTYGQLIRALDMDNRAEEAHSIWVKKIGFDLHSASWKICTLMISIYYRNNMLERLVKLFKGLEAFDRRPPDKQVVQKVANAYELLDLPEEQKRVLEKYNDLFVKTQKENPRKSKKAAKKKAKKSGEENPTVTLDDCTSITNDEQKS